MKLLIVSHPAVTPSNQALYAELQKQTGWDTSLVLPRRWPTEYGVQTASRWPAFTGRLIALPTLGAGNIPLHVYAARVRRLIAELSPDVIYVHHEPYGLATAQFLRAARSRPSIRLGFYSAQNIQKDYPWPVSALERDVYSRAHFAVPVTAEVSAVLRAKGYRGAIDVVPLPVDCDALANPPGSPVAGHLTLGYVGRLADEKGVADLLNALARVRDKPVSCLVAGNGPAADELHRLAAQLDIADRVEWLGYVPHHEVNSVYSRVDALVVPSRTVPGWKEQFGRVVVEALAAGKPVIASDSGSLPALLEQTEGGWTFREGSADELARIIRTLLENPDERHATGIRGARAVRRLFDVPVVAEQLAIAMQRDLQRLS
jgi:glycosyltransferase involved in cell wall biosynthesis